MDPEIVFHGTASQFSKFAFSKSDTHPSKIGVWFSSTEASAAAIARKAVRMADDVPRVISARILLKNPAKFETYADYLVAFRDASASAVSLRKKLRRAGFDGVEITHSDTDGAGDRTDFAVFELGQIEIFGSEIVPAARMTRRPNF